MRASAFFCGPVLLSSGVLAPARAQAPRFADLHRAIPWVVDATAAVALGDLDGDGDLDALVAVSGFYPAGQDRLYRNDGSGALADASAQLPAILDDTRALSLGDVDGDGDLDALVANFGQPHGLLLNGGAGVFSDAGAQLPPVVGPARAAALGDLDGDGDLDALIGNDAQQNQLFLNNGSGSFAYATAQLPPVFAHTWALALGDVDADGDLDALVANGQPGFASYNRLQLNNGSAAFVDATAQIPLVSAYTRSLALGDLDGDGDLDALLGNDSGSQNLLHLNNGAGVFTDATAQLPAVLDDTKSLALGDVDGDGDLDVLIGNDGPSRLYANSGSGVFTDATSQMPPTLEIARALALGDLDGDGDLDALIGNDGTQDRLYVNDGSGGFADATAHPVPEAQGTQALALGDVDGDGDLDALLGNDGQSRLYRNDGTGLFSDATAQLPAVSDDTYALAFGDVDGDGDLDLFVGNEGLSRLLLNGGAGTFVDAPSLLPPTPYAFTRGVALGDVDGDGDLDAVLGNYANSNLLAGGQDRLYVNGGSGAFSDAPAQIPTTFDFTFAVALGDVDGDGDLDVLFGNYGAQNRLCLNNGAGFFTNATTALPANIYPATYALAFGDVDGDGDLDALLGKTATERLLLNNGSGVFTDAAGALPPATDTTPAVALGDIDGDGDLDALAGNASPYGLGAQNRLYRNGGSGVFTDATSEMPSILDATPAVALGDVDGDGDLDAVFGNLGQASRIPVTNLTRQLAWRGIPGIGKPLVFDLYGPPSGGWILAFSLASASFPVPPLGTLRLDPPSHFVVAAGALDAQGRGSASFPVPPNPAFVGLSLYWQALVAPPLSFTNLEVTTFTNL
ncbi:MAG TPA: VCBS repeat-containing protein [Planctomycetota bacterium]|jgi:hypothetical protein|nr:VCBS repeat-containing protein [Planctomycetota bacterium]